MLLSFSFSYVAFIFKRIGVLQTDIMVSRRKKPCPACGLSVLSLQRHWTRHHLPPPHAVSPPRPRCAAPSSDHLPASPARENDGGEIPRTPTFQPSPSPSHSAAPPSNQLPVPPASPAREDDGEEIPRTPTYHPSPSNAEEWLHEPQCSLHLPGDEPPRASPTDDSVDRRDAAAQADGVGWTNTHPRRINLRHFPALHVVPPDHLCDAATQADGSIEERSRVTRSLFSSVEHVRVVKPANLPDIDSFYFTGERAFADRVPDGRPRPLCDCQDCVGHALALTRIAYPSEAPQTPGVTFFHVPGLQLRPSASDDRRRLERFLADNPDQSHVVCGCVPCTLHRNCVKAWCQARHYRDNPTGGMLSRRDISPADF